MRAIGSLVTGLAAACALSLVIGTAMAQPVKLRLGHGGAAEEPMWLIMAKPERAKNHGKAYTLETTRVVSSDKRAQAFEAGAIDPSAGGATGVLRASTRGGTADSR